MWGMGVRACKVAPMPRFVGSLRKPHRRHPWKSHSSCGSIECLAASWKPGGRSDRWSGWPLWFLSTRLLVSVEAGLDHVLLGSPAKRTCQPTKDSGSYGGCELWSLPATHIPVLGSPCHHLFCCKFGVIGCCLLAESRRLVPHTARPMSLSLLSCCSALFHLHDRARRLTGCVRKCHIPACSPRRRLLPWALTKLELATSAGHSSLLSTGYASQPAP